MLRGRKRPLSVALQPIALLNSSPKSSTAVTLTRMATDSCTILSRKMGSVW